MFNIKNTKLLDIKLFKNTVFIVLFLDKELFIKPYKRTIIDFGEIFQYQYYCNIMTN